MQQTDYRKTLKEYYNPSAKQPSFVNIPAMNFLMIDGEGAPESPQFAQAITTLYPIAYGLKFYIKKTKGIDYKVMPLEGLWWADDMSVFLYNKDTRDKSKWKWTLIIMQPDIVTKEDFNKIKEEVQKKKPMLDTRNVRFEAFTEGPSAQIMHIGPFSEEGPNIQKLHQGIEEVRGKISGKHHEIYLSDFRKVNPLKMKTVVRQPYTPKK